ncbi:hypothetical protein ISF_09523 [Cordyceps fumosorosea ARSEF 2679]|uniref:Uncharacterized protein n=1 Tax=Cordyceps fumosorosea (strain ARSEF 2679) TaxID=1081104 RepID=A0A167H643_CORFA|nr:hypothetical protein ISF_09523 [Cordyceps fumosorosea ARSEF 2679]OAA47531.1 hypothetical protein ISF_09523 [Cordyceps fumosorosea ARSEF 2679]
MEGARGRWASCLGLEASLARGQTLGISHFSEFRRTRPSAKSVATCQDYSAEETRQSRLHHCKGMETYIFVVYAWEVA